MFDANYLNEIINRLENKTISNEEVASLISAAKQLQAERDQFRELYLKMLAICKKLEQGIVGQKRERFKVSDLQIALPLIGMLTKNINEINSQTNDNKSNPEKPAKAKSKPTGRKHLPENLPRVDIVVIPPEVEKCGLDAFEKIGEDICETIERRRASLVIVRMHKPKFAPKNRDRLDDTKIFQASSPELPIERGLAGPSLLADTIVQRWQDHLPLHRLERIYGREGFDLARSTICNWHFELAKLVKPLISAMWNDAMKSPYLCIDATGVLVQEIEKCRNAHFFVVVAPEKHVLFGYTPKHNGAAVDKFLPEYKGFLVADAHSVYAHLYKSGKIIEVVCWAHARRYFFKALDSDPERAKQALNMIGKLFQIERTLATSPPEQRKKFREIESIPILNEFFEWCKVQTSFVLDETPISKAINYALNQESGLRNFIKDGRLPIHNNFSERELRREALGRKNWIFLGNDEGGEVNAAFVTLLASCELNGIEPHAYLRDLFCLLPSWPNRSVIELAPFNWQKTLENEDTRKRLESNVFRRVSLDFGNHSSVK